MGNIPSNHQRIWSDLSKIENESTRLKMIETLLAGQEYVASLKKMNLYSDILTWITAIKRGSWAEWPSYTPPATKVSIPTPLREPMSTSIINAPTRKAIDYLNEAYDLLGISDNDPLNLEMLKTAYKKRAIMYHPDKGGDPIMFDALTKAYLYLQEVYNKLIPKAGRDHADSTPVTMEAARARRVDNTIQSYSEQNDDIALVIHDPTVKHVAKKPTTAPAPAPEKRDMRPMSINPKQLNMDVFNQLFEQNKLPDPEKDDGYGDWLASQETAVKKNTKGLRGKFSIDVFNKTFDDEAKEQIKQDKNAALAKYNSPDALMLTPNAVILGGEKPSEYTAPAGSALHYTDLKAAYSTRTTFSHEIKDVKLNKKSLSQMKAERENDPGPASEEEMRHMEEIKMRTEAAERQRKMRLAANDTDISAYHDRIKSRLLITEKPLQ
jgi:curved DNA-binding protein CbpA